LLVSALLLVGSRMRYEDGEAGIYSGEAAVEAS